MKTTIAPSGKARSRSSRPRLSGRYESGRRREALVLAAAQAVLVNGGYAQLTLRRVARQAHISLALLQHYFRSKDELLRAVVHAVCGHYVQECDKLLSRQHGSAKADFLACIDYLIEDNRDPVSNTLFFELWALACHDAHANKLVAELYGYYRKYISRLIRNLRPTMSAHLIELRAAQIVALIEGLTLFIGLNVPQRAINRGLRADTRATVLRLATRV